MARLNRAERAFFIRQYLKHHPGVKPESAAREVRRWDNSGIQPRESWARAALSSVRQAQAGYTVKLPSPPRGLFGRGEIQRSQEVHVHGSAMSAQIAANKIQSGQMGHKVGYRITSITVERVPAGKFVTIYNPTKGANLRSKVRPDMEQYKVTVRYAKLPRGIGGEEPY